MDYSEYGGAGLFGLKAPVIKAHGSSDANAIISNSSSTRYGWKEVSRQLQKRLEKISIE